MSLLVAPVYYMYGAALLSKAQEDVGVLGGPMTDASAARDKKAGAEPAVVPSDPKGKGKAAAVAADDADDESDGSESDEEGEEGEATDLQVAWENLELARNIYSRERSHAEALAQVHVKLGQVSLEEEQFEKALVDFDAAHTLFLSLTPVPHRRLSGLLYDASMALQALQRPQEALQRIMQAVTALRQRLEELRVTTEEGAQHPEALEIQATMSDLQAREEELRESAEDEARTKEALKRAFAGMAGAATAGAGGGFDAPQLRTAAAPAADLGVVGRGVSRVTPQAVGAGAGATAAPAPKRFVPVPMPWPGSGSAPAPTAAAAAVAAPAEAAAKRPSEGAAAAPEAKAAKEGEAGECKQQ